MTYLELQKYTANSPIFSLAELRLADPNFNNIQLVRWQKKGYVKQIMRGWYLNNGIELTEELLMYIANKLISPSYISTQSIFSLHNLIPEGVFQITSITSKKTQLINSAVGNFSYQHLKPELMFGYRLQQTAYGNINIADLEKALLDFLYLNPKLKSHSNFEALRLENVLLKKLIDVDKFNLYLKNFNKPALTHRAQEFLNYVND